MKKILRLGTRGSPLALIQAEMVRAAMFKNVPGMKEDYIVELVPIRTHGDWKPEMAERTLAEMGANKGLFTKEIDEALLSGFIDVAVHSVKDMATVLPQHLEMVATLERADVRDAFLSQDGSDLDSLPHGAVIGTASLRRRVQLLARRPDLSIIPLRGNVETRLQKLSDGIAAATILAKAGLDRLGLSSKITTSLETEVMLPAVGQGAVGIVVSTMSEPMRDLVTRFSHAPTHLCVRAERAMLKVLDGSCRTPVAGLARMASDSLIVMEGLAARTDGTDLVRLQQSGPASDPEALGTALGEEIRGHFPEGFFCA